MTIRDLEFMPCFGIPHEVYQFVFDHRQNYDRFCCYVDSWDEKPVLRYFAYKDTKAKGIEITEVGRRTPYVPGRQIAKNIRFTQIAGYKAVYSEPLNPIGRYADFEPWQYDRWFSEPAFGYYAMNVNAERIFEFADFKYCGYSGTEQLAYYLEQYLANPAVEFFGKLGIRFSKVLFNRCKKDKQFRSFLIRNATDVNVYGVQATMHAYRNHVSIEEARRICYQENRLKREVSQWYTYIKDSGLDIRAVKKYVDTQGTYLGSYNDYIHSVMELGLDLNDTKNAFPKDFRRMHDLRTDEYNSLKARRKLESMLKQDSKFFAVASKLINYGYSDGKYTVIVPQHIEDLIKEGDALNHCVGKMGYDQKMIDERSYIIFIRVVGSEDVPFVTVEYDPKAKKVLQCYGNHDSKPDEEVLKFVEEWRKKVSGKAA